SHPPRQSAFSPAAQACRTKSNSFRRSAHHLSRPRRSLRRTPMREIYRCQGDHRTGQTSHDRKLSSGDLGVRWPGHLLVVALAVAEASVQHADETVGEGAERLVMGLALGALAVVEGACSG